MRFIHTADLHLGKRMNDISLIDDQIYALEKIHAYAVEKAADAVIIAGDIYQSVAPQAEAMRVFNDFVTGLAREGIRVLAISGNHDSASRVAYLGALIRESGVYVSEGFTGDLQQVELEDEYGGVTVSLLPFIKPVTARRRLGDECIETYQDAVAAIIGRAQIDPARRNVLICHQFITGAEAAGSEELYAGGLECVDARVFDGFDYVALGHIHRAQRVGRETVRYAGSPLKYSFSEARHEKSVTLVDLREKGEVEIELLPIVPRHDLRMVEGGMRELMAMPYTEDYVHVTVLDELVPPDARVTLAGVFPNMLRFGVSNSKTRQDAELARGELLERRSVEELFIDFYRLQNNDAEPQSAQLELMKRVLREVRGEDDEAD